MAAEESCIPRLEKAMSCLDVSEVVSCLEEVGIKLASEVYQQEDTSDDAIRKRIISSIRRRLEQPSSVESSLDDALSVLEGKMAISRLQAHSGSIPTAKVMEHLIKEDLATRDEKDEIERLRNSTERGSWLLEHLERGLMYMQPFGKGMKVLYAALTEVRAFHLAKLVFPDEPLLGGGDVVDPRKYEVMTKHHDTLLNRNRVKLNSIDVNKVIPQLMATEQLDGYDADIIRSEKTTNSQAAKLIDILLTKSDFAFYAFLSALYQNGYQHLVTLVDSTFRCVQADLSQFTSGSNAAGAGSEHRNDRVRLEGSTTQSTPTGHPRPSQAVAPTRQQTAQPTSPTAGLPFSEQAISDGLPADFTQNPPSSQVNDYLYKPQTEELYATTHATNHPPAVIERARLVGATLAPTCHTVPSGACGLSQPVVNGTRQGGIVNPSSGIRPSHPGAHLVTDLTEKLESVLNGSEWTYTVLWFVATHEDSSAVMAILKKHGDALCEEVSLGLIQTLQFDVKVIFIDRGGVRKLIILVTQGKPGQDQAALTCSLIVDKCKFAHMAVMSGTCSGFRSETELGDIILADTAYTTEFRATEKETERQVSVEMAHCPQQHLSVLTTRMMESELLWQQKSVCECGRPPTTKEYQFLFGSRVLVEFNRRHPNGVKWLEKFKLKINEELLSDDNTEALEKSCPLWSDIASEAEKLGKWVDDDRDEAPYGLKPSETLEAMISKSIRKDRNYPAEPKTFPDLKRRPMFTSSSEHHNAKSVFADAKRHKHKCIAVDSEAYKFYEIAHNRLAGKPAFVAKGVSNFADGELEDEAFEKYARQISAVFLLDAIRMFAEAEEKNERQRTNCKPLYTDL